MKKKHINSIICKKVDAWLASIEDETLRKELKDKVIVTGGSIASLIQNEKPKDYDIYFTDVEAATEAAHYYVNQWERLHGARAEVHIINKSAIAEAYYSNNEELANYAKSWADRFSDDQVSLFIPSTGIVSEVPVEDDGDDIVDFIQQSSELTDTDVEEAPVEKPKYRPVFFSGNAITLSNGIQLILRFTGCVEKIHSNFDFLHATNYWTSKDRAVVFNIDAYECVHNKELRYVGSKYPLCSFFRMRKFINRGYTINAGEIVKMAFNLNEFNLHDVPTLMDQLVGVDSSYFTRFITALRSHGGSVDRSYVTTILNRLFN